ncbi:MAG: hypothetical protein IT464_11860 [Planctomycetes bacterium]|nr:hypothetical protein [Planctomycetota bacterium]
MKTPAFFTATLFAALALLASPTFSAQTAACPACKAEQAPATSLPEPAAPAPTAFLCADPSVPAPTFYVCCDPTALPEGGRFTIETEETLRDTVTDEVVEQ